jgi:hypothetical protein
VRGTWQTTGGPGGGRAIVIIAAIGVIAASGGVSGALSGLTELLWWLAGVFWATATVVTALVIRATRRRTPDYVRSIHGPTIRDHDIDENQRLLRETREIRATRLALERERLHMNAMQLARAEFYGPLGPGWMQPSPAAPDYSHHGTITGRIPVYDPAAWTAEVISDTADSIPGHESGRD